MTNNFLRVLKPPHNHASYTPVWLMRQAGRYLPEYIKIRNQAGSFLNLCKNPELATEVTLQPLRRFALDAAIMFSDILVVPEAMGMNLYFSDSAGPKFSNPLKNSLDVDALQPLYPKLSLGYVLQTIKNLKQELPLTVPLIGFSGSPWTLACYMVEGGSSKNYEKIKAWVYAHPGQLHQLLDKLALAVADYLIAQIEAGVDTIMLFDSWGGVLSHNKFVEFSLSYMHKIFDHLKFAGYAAAPSITFTKGGGTWLNDLKQLPCTALSIDWTLDLAQARSQTTKILQGNLDPLLLSVADYAIIKKEVALLLNNYKAANNGSWEGLIFNLGHGILPSAKPDNVAFLVDAVHELTRR